MPVVEVDQAISNAAGVKNLRDGRIRYNTFLKAMCPAYFADEDETGKGHRTQYQPTGAQNAWYPWGTSSGGGSLLEI